MHIRHGFCLALSLVALAGCVDPEGELDEFKNNYSASTGGSAGAAGAGGSAGGVDAGPCVAPAAGEIDGKYLFALAPVTNGAKASYKKPILADATVTSTAAGSDLEVKITLQPLNATDRATPEGNPIDVPAFTVASDGSFDLTTLGEVDFPGAANPISGSDLTANITSMKGTICNADGFFCGDIAGNVTVPLPLDLAGSTFTYEKAEGAPPYPEPPKLNCKKDLAEPLP